MSSVCMSFSVPVNTWGHTDPPPRNALLQECYRRAVYPGGK